MTEIKVIPMNLEEAVLTCLELSIALSEARRAARERSAELSAREREHSNALSTIHDQQLMQMTLQQNNEALSAQATSDAAVISRLNDEIRVLTGRLADQTTMIEKLQAQISQHKLSRKIDS